MSPHRLIPLALFAIAGCVTVPPSPPPQQAEPVRPAPTPLPAPVPDQQPAPAANWLDRPLTPGIWDWKADPRGAVALYGPVGKDAVLAVRCDRAAQRIYISRPALSGTQMTLRATTGLKTYPARPTGGTPSYVAVDLAARDQQLDAIAFSRGRFMVSLDGAADVIAPSWPEVARVIEECR